MKKHIAEELPARKHAPAAAPAPAAKGKGGAAPKGGEKREGGEGEGSEKRIRQAVYDIRYRARREDIDLKAAFSQYMSNSSLSQAERSAVREKLFGKAGGVSEQFSVDSVDWAIDGVAGAMLKVFVEGVEQPKLELVYERQMEGKEGTKYQVRVLDPKSGRSYVRMATREKITQLRARGLKVEMTDAGEPYEGRKAKKDYDGDGKVESSSKEHAGAVHNAIQRAKGGKPDGQDTRKEDFLWTEANGATGTTSTEGQNRNKITGAGVDNSSRIRVFPQDGSDIQAGSGVIQAGTEFEGPLLIEKAKSKAQQRFMGMVYAAKKGEKAASPEVAKAAKGMSKKEAKKFAKTKHKGLPEKKEMKEEMEGTCPKCGKSPCECDTRANATYRSLLKTKMRSAGKNVLAMCGDEENLEKSYDDMMTASFIKTNRETGKLEPVHVFREEEDRRRDKHQERGGMGARVDYDRPPAKKKTNKEMGIRDFTPAEKEERAKQMSAHLKKMGRA